MDDEIIESLRGPIGLIPIAFGLYLITAYLPLHGSLDLIARSINSKSLNAFLEKFLFLFINGFNIGDYLAKL